jgi:formamidopyrimidine-DNA glycosylase
MPELPDLETLKDALARRVTHRPIADARAHRPGILKTVSPTLDALRGRAFTAIERSGKHLIFTLAPDLHLVTHLMLAGRFVLCKSQTKPTKATGLVITFADGEDLRLIENGSIKLVKVYVVEDPKSIEGIASAGLEPLSPAFTPDVLRQLTLGQRRQAKKLLTDQRKIVGIGTAYADEILFRARISPVRYVSTLTEDELLTLHHAVRDVLNEAIGQIRDSIGDSLFTDEIRDFLRVHKHTGDPCPICGEKIAEIRYANTRTYYCPICQAHGKSIRDRRSWLTR